MATNNKDIDPLESIAFIFRLIGAVLASISVVLAIAAFVKHNHRLGIAVAIIGLLAAAILVASGQFKSKSYVDDLGTADPDAVKVKSTAKLGKEERFVRSINAQEDHRRAEILVENFREMKRLPECACTIKLNSGEVCHYSTPARFEKANDGTMLVTSARLIFFAKGVFNQAELKSLTQLIRYDSGSVGIASKQNILPDVYDVAFPGELLTCASLACMAAGLQGPPIEQV